MLTDFSTVWVLHPVASRANKRQRERRRIFMGRAD
jgi:hypothetical protein